MTAGSCGNKLLFFFFFPTQRKELPTRQVQAFLQTTVYTYHLFPCWVMSTFLLPLLALCVKHIIKWGVAAAAHGYADLDLVDSTLSFPPVKGELKLL